MYGFLKRWKDYKHCGSVLNVLRNLNSTEVATALRPFYFAVHPDLFGQYPEQRIMNENSLKLLNSFLESIQAKQHIIPTNVKFYIRKTQEKRGNFTLVDIPLRDKDTRTAVLNILKACDLPTGFVDKIPAPSRPPVAERYRTSNIEKDDIFGTEVMMQKIRRAREEFSLKNWLIDNVVDARLRTEAGQPVREEIERLQNLLRIKLKLFDIKWECGWDISHFRGCLQALQALSNHYPEQMYVLRDRVLIFAPCTGVSLKGHVMLNSAEVRNNWLDLIKKVPDYDKVILRIPAFEKALSQVLLNIKVGRRKFMPHVMAGDYETHLRSIVTSLNDYKSTKQFPKTWPKSFHEHEIVVETESGPLMLSPTGQFIVPSSCPGFLLVNFITNNFEDATKKLADYKNHKHLERALHSLVVKTLELRSLRKGDNVTPELMIKCCERLLEFKVPMAENLRHLSLLVTTYYSVMSDGTVCIPWNWKSDF